MTHKFFFVGIGGISMSGLAAYVRSCGYRVCGSDVAENQQTRKLKRLGIKIFIGHDAKNVQDCEVVVFNSAISDDNPEINYAKEHGLLLLTRAELLSKISKEHEHVIAVAGTHGKTTTTAMIGEIFTVAGLKPTVHLGGISKNLNTNFVVGQKSYFITEACEYKNNFLTLKPDCSVVLNVEEDHMDFFKTRENLFGSFEKFVINSKMSFICDNLLKNNEKYEKNQLNYQKNHKNIKIINLNFGFCFARNIKKQKDKKFSFNCFYNNKLIGKIKLNVFHEHNIMNALFAAAVAKYYGISDEIIVKALSNFHGVKRRFEQRKNYRGAKVIIDYAHHPHEIKDAISVGKDITSGRLFVIFQPHTYSRTQKLFSEFVKELSASDELLIFKTYPAREPFCKAGDAKTLQKAINLNKKCSFFNNFSKMKEFLDKNISKGDTILILGAGDIDQFATFLKIDFFDKNAS